MIDDHDNLNDTAETTSLSLLERAKANDAAAWERLRDLYVPLVFQWCRQSGVRAADVPDVGQEVFVAVADGLLRFRRDRDGDTFRGWLRTLTRNKIADMRRQRQGGLDAAGGSDAQRQFTQIVFDDPSEEISPAGEVEILYVRAIEIIGSEFPDWYKVAFLRVVVDEHRPEDVAADLEKRTSAIYNAKSRILRRLREEFADALE